MVKPFRIAFLWDAVTDKRKSRRAQSDELIRIHRKVTRVLASKTRLRRSVLHEVSCHPVVLSAGEALDCFAEVASQQRCSSPPRRTHKNHRKTLVKGQGHQGGLAVA